MCALSVLSGAFFDGVVPAGLGELAVLRFAAVPTAPSLSNGAVFVVSATTAMSSCCHGVSTVPGMFLHDGHVSDAYTVNSSPDAPCRRRRWVSTPARMSFDNAEWDLMSVTTYHTALYDSAARRLSNIGVMFAMCFSLPLTRHDGMLVLPQRLSAL